MLKKLHDPILIKELLFDKKPYYDVHNKFITLTDNINS